VYSISTILKPVKHENPAITTSIYAHVMVSMGDETAVKVDETNYFDGGQFMLLM